MVFVHGFGSSPECWDRLLELLREDSRITEMFDLACFARMCVPIDDAPSRIRVGWRSVDADLPRRLRVVADAYGLDAPGRAELLAHLDDAIARGGLFVLRRVEAGDANFIAMWESMGGVARFDRRRAWWSSARPTFAAALSP